MNKRCERALTVLFNASRQSHGIAESVRQLPQSQASQQAGDRDCQAPDVNPAPFDSERPSALWGDGSHQLRSVVVLMTVWRSCWLGGDYVDD